MQEHQRKKHVVRFARGLYGHIKKYCRSYQEGKNKINNITSVKTNEETGKFNVVGFLNSCNNNDISNALKLVTKINGNEIEFEIETGDCKVLCVEVFWIKILKNVKKSNITAK